MSDQSPPPKNIEELWYRLDKRLMAIELCQAAASKTLDDHEQPLRASGTLASIIAGSSGLLALIAIIKSFFG